MLLLISHMTLSTLHVNDSNDVGSQPLLHSVAWFNGFHGCKLWSWWHRWVKSGGKCDKISTFAAFLSDLKCVGYYIEALDAWARQRLTSLCTTHIWSCKNCIQGRCNWFAYVENIGKTYHASIINFSKSSNSFQVSAVSILDFVHLRMLNSCLTTCLLLQCQWCIGFHFLHHQRNWHKSMKNA